MMIGWLFFFRFRMIIGSSLNLTYNTIRKSRSIKIRYISWYLWYILLPLSLIAMIFFFVLFPILLHTHTIESNSKREKKDYFFGQSEVKEKHHVIHWIELVLLLCVSWLHWLCYYSSLFFFCFGDGFFCLFHRFCLMFLRFTNTANIDNIT